MNTPVLPDLLLVEPQFVVRRTMVAVAREMRVAEIHEATSVARALPVLRMRPFRGLVLDVGDDEAEACSLLQQLRAGDLASPPDLPVVALAAEWQHALAGKLDRIPRLRVLPKPFRIRQLLESLSRMGLG